MRSISSFVRYVREKHGAPSPGFGSPINTLGGREGVEGGRWGWDWRGVKTRPTAEAQLDVFVGGGGGGGGGGEGVMP